MRDITCPADLDRLPACPSCQQLQRDLAAARAERDRLREALHNLASVALTGSTHERHAMIVAARAALEKANG